MNLFQLALKNISGNAFRSWVVAICALLVAAFALFTTLLMRGAETSLRLALDRLGADVVVVPVGAEAKMESALLMGIPARFWMPQANVGKIAAPPGSSGGFAAAVPGDALQRSMLQRLGHVHDRL